MVGFQGHLVQHGETGTVAHLGVSELTAPNAGQMPTVRIGVAHLFLPAFLPTWRSNKAAYLRDFYSAVEVDSDRAEKHNERII